MKIEINIDEGEVIAEAKRIVSKQIADELHKEWGSGYQYKKMIKEIVREVIKSDIDNIVERAIVSASKSIEARGVKRIVESVLSKEEE